MSSNNEPAPDIPQPLATLTFSAFSAEDQRTPSAWRLEGPLYIQDRPGQLAAVARVTAAHQGCIKSFFYDRAKDLHRIDIIIETATADALGRVADALGAGGFLAPPEGAGSPVTDVTDLGGLLRIRVMLEDVPGTLADFSSRLSNRDANVLFVEYTGGMPQGVATMALHVPSAELIPVLIEELRGAGYHFSVEWQGMDGSFKEAVGLCLVESFLLGLKETLPEERLSSLAEMMRSSTELQESLMAFRQEAGGSGESLAAAEVFSRILELGAASNSKTGPYFSLRLTGPLALTPRVSLYGLACPTGATSYLLRGEHEDLLIDTSYGLYYADARDWLRAHGFDLARVKRLALTHADTDHAGWASFLQQEHGAEVLLHPQGLGILQSENRAHGSGSKLEVLNGLYTRIINRLTEMREPERTRPYDWEKETPQEVQDHGEFRTIGTVSLEDLRLHVLESHGGHVPGQVFFFEPELGCLFSGDYLIDLQSLSDRDKTTLSLARYLVMSTNSDSRMFSREMNALKALMRGTHHALAGQGKVARVFPGHGDFYAVGEADWLEEKPRT